MTEYCATRERIDGGPHIIHRCAVDCSLATGPDACRDLGGFPNDDEAMLAARERLGDVDGCPQCMPDASRNADAESINAAVAAAITISNL